MRIKSRFLLGEDELSEGVMSVKNMKTGEQKKLRPEEAVLMIQAAIREKTAIAPVKG